MASSRARRRSRSPRPSVRPRLTSLSPALRTTLGRLVPFAAVASAGVLNVFLMRGEEIRRGIDVFRVPPAKVLGTAEADGRPSGTSRRAALIAVSETALSRVINATPIMVLPPLVLLRLQRQRWLASNPRLVLPVNIGLILATSLVALPCALGVFPARQRVPSRWLEDEFHDVEWLEFNRGL